MIKPVVALALVACLSACAVPEDTATRMRTEAPRLAAQGGLRAFAEQVGKAGTVAAPDLALAARKSRLDPVAISVAVPRHLRVNEVNAYYPSGDIVWRGEAPGDRHAQVQAILSDALREALTGDRPGADTPVVVSLELDRFHALTEKARYTLGGWHEIRFTLSVRHAETGAEILPPQEVSTRLKAYGGARAVEADARGETQRLRITRHLADLLRAEVLGLGPRDWPAPQPPVTVMPQGYQAL